MGLSPIGRVVSSLMTPQLIFAVGFALTMTVGYFTYFKSYQEPRGIFWDENYHIASAQKYLNRVFFMEPHPPLGKLIIALGEYVISPNKKRDHFLETDHASKIPPDFSFAGYRFFPSLFAWLAGVLLYLLFMEMTRSPIKSFLFSLPYLLDNALIVHTRGAMLEGPQLFFILLFLLFFYRRTLGISSIPEQFLMGLAMGAAVFIKVNSLFLLAFPLYIVWVERRDINRRVISSLLVSYGAALLVGFSVWTLHFELGKKIVPALPNGGYYGASEGYRQKLLEGERLSFFASLLEHHKFTKSYTLGVPRFDACKPGENGSYPIFWPVGGSAILYRWDGTSERVRYLYLQSNPVAWLLALLAVIVLSASATANFFGQGKNSPPLFARALLFGYWGYMAIVLSVSRVLYLYHYFIPLLMGYLLISYALESVKKIWNLVVSEKQRSGFLVLACILTFASYLFFSPFTYYNPLTPFEVDKRKWLEIWKIHCEMCTK